MVRPDLLPFLLFLPVVLFAGLGDLRSLRIPNYLVFVGVALFLATAPLLSGNEILLRAVIGAACFGLCFLAFAFRLMGGGDTKFLPVIFLFVPSSDTAVYMYCLALGLALGMSSLHLLRRSGIGPVPGWASLERAEVFPVGFAMALSVLAYAGFRLFV